MSHRSIARVMSWLALAFAVFCVGFAIYGIVRDNSIAIFVGVTSALSCGANGWLLRLVGSGK